jgi:hypothetical protein
MALTHNPSIVNSGLVVAFDAANAKSYQNNLLLYSQSFTGWDGFTGWFLQNITQTSTTNIAPDGTPTASLFTTTSSGYTPIYQGDRTIVAGSTLTLSVYFRVGSSTTLQLTVGNGGLTNNFRIIISNLTTTPTVVAANTGTATYISSSLIFVGNGWYRASVTGIIDSSTTLARVDFPIATSLAVGSNIYLWGAQLNVGSGPAPYIATTSSTIPSTWLDLTGTYRGTVSNTISYSTANSGSIVFTSSANANVATQNSTISLVNGGTLEMWVNLSNNSIAQGFVALTRAPRYINFYMDTASTFGKMRWEAVRTGVSTFDLLSTTVFSTNTWYHVVGTFNATSYYLYINSVLEASNTSYQSAPIDSISAPLVIGSYAGQASASIPMVRFYNRALTADEVLQNFNAHRGRYGI